MQVKTLFITLSLCKMRVCGKRLKNNLRAHIGRESVTFDRYNDDAVKGCQVFSSILQQTSTIQVTKYGTLKVK